ncbi:oxidoreductase [Streptomyces sp. NPDC058052]|uniref:oxidoreductase n=1 Tax=Streptomyces sp. NPDC058052 TaxID=3346316 RepID=UPI0036E7432A
MTDAPGPYGYGYAPAPPSPKPGVIPLAPLDLGDVLAGAFAAYRRHWAVLLGMALTTYAVAAALIAGVGLAAWAGLADHYRRWADTPTPGDPGLRDLAPLLAVLGTVWLVCAVALLVATALLNAAVATVVQETVLGRRAGFGTVWRRAWSRLGPVLGSLVPPALAALVPVALSLVGLCLMLAAMIVNVSAHGGHDEGVGLALTGLLALLLSLGTLPFALWIWVRYSLAPAAAVIESAGPVAAMRRSAELVRGSWWRIFGCTLVMLLIVGAVSFVVQTGVSAVSQLSMFSVQAGMDLTLTPGTLFAAAGALAVTLGLVQLLTHAFLAPLQPLVSGLLYVDQRIRKENLGPVLAETASVPRS